LRPTAIETFGVFSASDLQLISTLRIERIAQISGDDREACFLF